MAKIRTRICKICGKEFQTENKRLCCSDECSRENGRQNCKMRREKIERIYSAGKSRKTISNIAAKAKEAGMSYGMYVASMNIR